MKNYLLLLGTFFTTIISAQQRVVLYEHFSNANCSSCATFTPQLTAFVEGKQGEAVMLGYQINTPYSDGIYNENKADVDARRNVYSISGSPYTIMDGNYFKNGTAPFLNQATAKHTARKAVDATFEIDLSNLQRTGDYVTGNITITSIADNTGNTLKAFIVFAEKTVLKSSYNPVPGNNSETQYPYVMRKFSPDASGVTLFKKDVNEVNTINVNQIVPNVKSWEELRVIAFVQNTTTNEVYQAAMSTPAIVSSIADKEEIRFSVSPNPANTFVDVKIGSNEPVELFLSNTIGENILTKNFTTASRISLEGLPQGIYLLTIRDEKGTSLQTKRIIKQ